MTPSLQTLFLPLVNGDIVAKSPVLFLYAGWDPAMANQDLNANFWHFWQPWRPAALTLETKHFEVSPSLPDGTYALILIDMPKQADEAKGILALAAQRLSPNGMLVACAQNDAGGTRLVKWMQSLGLSPRSFSKNKCRVVWADPSGLDAAKVDQWMQAAAPTRVEYGDGIQFLSVPGVFSWDHADEASRLLCDYLPDTVEGVAADFGCGIGYLSYRLLKKNIQISSLYCIDADRRAVECCEQNLGSFAIKREYLWHDLNANKPQLPPLDFIIMNPPFHTGKKTNPALGVQFIRTASACLKKEGRLLMVANAHLPYEAAIESNFASARIIAQTNGFKVIEALK